MKTIMTIQNPSKKDIQYLTYWNSTNHRVNRLTDCFSKLIQIKIFIISEIIHLNDFQFKILKIRKTKVFH